MKSISIKVSGRTNTKCEFNSDHTNPAQIMTTFLTASSTSAGLGFEGQSAGEHLIEHHTQRVDIGSWTQVFVTSALFRRHILWGTDCHPSHPHLLDDPVAPQRAAYH